MQGDDCYQSLNKVYFQTSELKILIVLHFILYQEVAITILR